MEKSATRPRIPTCFISYSWDSDSHKTWVRSLAEKLQDKAVATTLDQWDVRPGSDFFHYMESAIRESEFVLLVCTPNFRDRSDHRKGGVGYEGSIITSELFSRTQDQTKFVPILRAGDESSALPSYLKSRVFIDFRNTANFDKSFEELLRHLYDEPKYKKPPLGIPPTFHTEKPSAAQIERQESEKSGSEVFTFSTSIFLNSSFDVEGLALLKTQAFTVMDCGFNPRSVLEVVDPNAKRLDQLFALMASSKYSIHEITPRIQESKGLPRFNMPFELGIWLGIQRTDRRTRKALVLENEKYGFQRYFSDIVGLDVQAHGNDQKAVIRIIRQWLSAESNAILPSPSIIQERYKVFTEDLPEILRKMKVSEKDLTFNDYAHLVSIWIKSNKIAI